MSKVDLNRIPNWEVGRWYFYNGLWLKMDSTDLVEEYPIVADCFRFTKEGKFNPHHKERDLLEPWEVLILHEGYKAIAPEGVDWSVPVECMELPKCLTKEEFESLDPYDILFYFDVNDGIYEGTKSDYECWTGEYGESESGFYLSEDQAETFKALYEAGLIEFDGTAWKMKADETKEECQTPWVDKPLPEAPQPLPEKLFEQNRALLARNGELKAEIDTLNCKIYNLENPVDFTDHDTEAKLKEENEQLKSKNEALNSGYEQMSQLAKERSFDIEKQNERLNELESDLAQAKILIADWAIKLKYYGEL